jgi:molecular chaperone Hsp33
VRGFSQRLADHTTNLQGLLEDIFPDLDPQPLERLANRQGVNFQCPCSRERSVGALQLLGRNELTAMLQEDGQAEVTCHFCNEHYLVEAPELEALIEAVS